MGVELQRRRFTVDEYYAMVDAGILSEDDRVELIEGEIIQMAAIGSRHAACVNRLNQLFVEQAAGVAVVTVQNPVRLSDLTEPQPDLALARARDDFYAGAHPRPEDTLLVVEVAHTTLGYDRGTKLPLYAVAGVPEVWIVNVEEGEVEVYRDPAPRGFRTMERLGPGQVLHVVALPGIEIPVERVVD